MYIKHKQPTRNEYTAKMVHMSPNPSRVLKAPPTNGPTAIPSVIPIPFKAYSWP